MWSPASICNWTRLLTTNGGHEDITGSLLWSMIELRCFCFLSVRLFERFMYFVGLSARLSETSWIGVTSLPRGFRQTSCTEFRTEGTMSTSMTESIVGTHVWRAACTVRDSPEYRMITRTIIMTTHWSTTFSLYSEQCNLKHQNAFESSPMITFLIQIDMEPHVWPEG